MCIRDRSRAILATARPSCTWYHVSCLSLILFSGGIIVHISYSNINKHNINVHLDIYFNTTVLLFSLNLTSTFLPGNHPPFVVVVILYIYIFFLYNRTIKYVTITGHSDDQISELVSLVTCHAYFMLKVCLLLANKQMMTMIWLSCTALVQIKPKNSFL